MVNRGGWKISSETGGERPSGGGGPHNPPFIPLLQILHAAVGAGAGPNTAQAGRLAQQRGIVGTFGIFEVLRGGRGGHLGKRIHWLPPIQVRVPGGHAPAK